MGRCPCSRLPLRVSFEMTLNAPSFSAPRMGRCRKFGFAAALFACVLVLSACSPERPEADALLILTGSSTVAPAAAELASRFEKSHPGIRIDVQSGGSSRGIADARNGLASIGMVSRALKADESDLHVVTIARDGVALIVHESNPVDALKREEVIALYRGEVDVWSLFGGSAKRPVVVHKADGRATLEVFLAYFGLDPREVIADVIVGENEQAIKTVSGNPNAVAYVSIGSASVNIANGAPIKLLSIDGVTASLATLREGRYPISRPLNLVLKDPPRGLAAEFIAFVRSEAARDVFDALSFVQVAQ